MTSHQHGKVFAVFSKAIYLLTDANELLWIVMEDAPMHQRAIQIQAPLPAVDMGAPFHTEQQCLNLNSAYILNSKDAYLWHAPTLSRADTLEISALFLRISAFFSNLDMSRAKGFGYFIPSILSLAQNPGTDIYFESTDPVLLYAKNQVLNVARACLRCTGVGLSELAASLIGLGSGLTPSGDDFLGGLLFVLHVLRQVYADSDLFTPDFSTELFSSRTNLISYTLLQDLANGHAIAPLHETIKKLLSRESLESIYPFISQLTSVGNSTGWDLLAGLLTGFLILSQSNNQSISLPIHRMTEA
ncbi:MAG: DUF2877 domain-containing protein [Anaerolineales bacterium]